MYKIDCLVLSNKFFQKHLKDFSGLTEDISMNYENVKKTSVNVN